MNRIYLDHAATSPLRPEARTALEEGFAIWANPSSPHADGRKAKAALEDARERCKEALGWTGELIFTSGASEAASLALYRAKGGARLVSAVEHDCILGALPDAERLPVRVNGALDMDVFEEAVAREHPVVAIQHVNSETGNMQDLSDIARLVEAHGGILLTDCAQSAGKLPLPVCDIAMVSAHKFGGPIGIGALLVRNLNLLEPVGGHERGYRRGTENLPAVMGMAAALEAVGSSYSPASFNTLADTVRTGGGIWLGDRIAQPTPYVAAITHPAMSGTAQVMRLDMAGFAVSQGSACSSGTMKTSHVLEAMGLETEVAGRTIRVSIGWNTTEADIESFAKAWQSLG